MSSSIVRAAARAVVTAPTWPSEYIETVGDAPDPNTLPDAWSGIGFDGQSDNPIGVGPTATIRETGRVTFHFFRRAGSGDASVVSDAELAAGLIRAHSWAASAIALVSISAPVIPDEGGLGGFLEAQIQVDYERDHL